MSAQPAPQPEEVRSQAYAEMAVLSSLKSVDDFKRLQLVNPTFLAYDNIYELVQQYVIDHGAIPPAHVVMHADPEFEYIEGAPDYWIGEYVRSRIVREAELIAKRLHGSVSADPYGEIARAIQELQALTYNDARTAHAMDTALADRFDRYLERVEAARRLEQARINGETTEQLLLGIETGLGAIDETKQGWMAGELVGIYARPAVGKSWLLLRMGVIAWLTNKRVLLISPEMTLSQIAARTDALLAGHLNITGYSQHGVEVGNPAAEQAFRQLRDLYSESWLSESERWYTVDSSMSTAEIETLIGYYRPDIVLIDGIMLLRDEGRGRDHKTWERMLEYSYDLKRIATQHETSIVVTNQAVNTRRGRVEREESAGEKKTTVDVAMPSLDNAAYGDAFVQAMSTVITLAPDPYNARIRWYSIRKARERNVKRLGRLALGWDVDRGLIVDASECGTSVDAVVRKIAEYGIR